jgi:hypothetical protein
MEETIEFFSKYKTISVILHVLSVIVGMGAALVSDILFNFFIKDKKIQHHENKTLFVLSNIVWASLFFIVLSGLMLFLSNPVKYIDSTKFLVKITIVGVIIINGYLFWRVIHPALRKINFTDTNIHHKYVRLRKMAFALGAVSVISWLSAFILGMLKNIYISYWQAIIGYIVVCLCGVLASQLMDYKMSYEKIKSK